MTSSGAISPTQSIFSPESFSPLNGLLSLECGQSSAPIPLRYRADGSLSSKNNITVTFDNEPFNNNPFRSLKTNLYSPKKNIIPDILSVKKSRKNKLSYRVRENVIQMAKTFKNRLGFLTITFKDDLKIWKKDDIAKASRAFIKFRKTFINKYCEPAYIKVIEGTRKGRIHYHLVIALKDSIFEKFSWNSYEYQKHFTIRNHKLHGIKYASLMAIMERKAKKSGLGRLDLNPIKHEIAASKYLAKYLMKYQSLMLSRGYRQVTFSVKFTAFNMWGCNSRFGWAGASSRSFRKLIASWAEEKGYSEESMPENWVHKFRREVGISTQKNKIYLEL